MPVFKIAKTEKKVGKQVTFNKESDYVAVRLMKNDKPIGDVKLLHHIQAEKLIEKKKAIKVTNQNIEEVTPVVSTKVIDK